MEPLTNPQNRRFTLFPIQHPNLWLLYQKQEASFWRASEVDFSKDAKGFQQLTQDEQFFIKRILAFFAASDGIVNLNISTRFLNEVTILEALMFYQLQMAMENVHNVSYSLMLSGVVKDPEEQTQLFNAFTEVPSVKQIADWSLKWIESDLPFAFRVVAFAVMEGVIFSGAFSCIFWLKKHRGNYVEGLIKSNEFIARDEAMHVEFACELYKMVQNRLSLREVMEVVGGGVDIAVHFMTDALPCRLIGINSGTMADYLHYVADILLVDLGYGKQYGAPNPFPFMDSIGLHEKTDFFASRPTSYQSAFGMGKMNEDVQTLEDF